jgi:hypothetical protein
MTNVDPPDERSPGPDEAWDHYMDRMRDLSRRQVRIGLIQCYAAILMLTAVTGFNAHELITERRIGSALALIANLTCVVALAYAAHRLKWRP